VKFRKVSIFIYVKMLHSSYEGLNICLFSFRDKDIGEYKELLKDFKVRIINVEKEEDCKSLLESAELNGILVDIPSYVKSSMQTKEFVSGLVSIYPSARIRYNRENNDMDVFPFEEVRKIPLQEFLDRCCLFMARKIRKYVRIAVNLNIRVFYEQRGKPVGILCTGTNISEKGLFAINGTENLLIGTKVKIQISELGKENYLHGTVVRSLEWGEKFFHPPGFGIRIDEIDPEIFDDYIELTKKFQPSIF